MLLLGRAANQSISIALDTPVRVTVKCITKPHVYVVVRSGDTARTYLMKKDDIVSLHRDTTMHLIKHQRNYVQLGFAAPSSIKILREELCPYNDTTER